MSHLTEVAPPPQPLVIPPDLSRPVLLAHTRRMASFVYEYGLRVPPAGPIAREAWAALPRFALGLSWAVDLGLIEGNTGAITRAVWPRQWRFSPTARDAVGTDVPRYEPGEPPVMDRSCQAGRGPRGGRCRATTVPVRRVVNEASGEYVLVWACDEHSESLRAVAHRAPRPRPNRGGVLAAVFPEVDMDVIYAWANSRYRPDETMEDPDPTPVRLRLIHGGQRR